MKARGVIDVVLGFLIGGLVSAIVAVNVIIYSGIEYHVTLPEVFRRNLAVGLLVTCTLVAGPVVGVLLARRRHGDRSSTGRVA